MNKNIKTAIIIGGVIIAVLVILSVVWGIFGGEGYRYGFMGPRMMSNFGWWWLMPIFMIIFWGLVIWGIVVLVRGLYGTGKSSESESALDVLKKRYARGEISKEEFEQKKKDLL